MIEVTRPRVPALTTRRRRGGVASIAAGAPRRGWGRARHLVPSGTCRRDSCREVRVRLRGPAPRVTRHRVGAHGVGVLAHGGGPPWLACSTSTWHGGRLVSPCGKAGRSPTILGADSSDRPARARDEVDELLDPPEQARLQIRVVRTVPRIRCQAGRCRRGSRAASRGMPRRRASTTSREGSLARPRSRAAPAAPTPRRRRRGGRRRGGGRHTAPSCRPARPGPTPWTRGRDGRAARPSAAPGRARSRGPPPRARRPRRASRRRHPRPGGHRPRPSRRAPHRVGPRRGSATPRRPGPARPHRAGPAGGPGGGRARAVQPGPRRHERAA